MDQKSHDALCPRDAPAPFNKPSATLILRTSDHVDFRVRLSILVEASPFFEDMLTLPNGPDDAVRVDQEYRDGLLVVAVTETSRTMENLLRFCYPVANPTLTEPVEICDVLEASRKYLMEDIEAQIHLLFVNSVDAHPLAFYAYAVMHGWREEIRLAAKASLQHPFPAGTFVREMEFMSTGAYIRLGPGVPQNMFRCCGGRDLQALRSDAVLLWSTSRRSGLHANTWTKSQHPSRLPPLRLDTIWSTSRGCRQSE